MTLSLTVDLTQQRLTVWQAGRAVTSYAVSTGKTGVGEIAGSGCTPRGRHVVRAKIGGGQPLGTVFVGRRVAQDVPVISPAAQAAYPRRDWILTRILWLSGTEHGKNRLGCVDTFRRYIYIHGTPEVAALGTPVSHGCIRMECAALATLFDMVSIGTEVTLHE